MVLKIHILAIIFFPPDELTASFVLEPPEEFQSEASVRTSAEEIAGVHTPEEIAGVHTPQEIAGVHTTSDLTISKDDSTQPLATEDTAEEGYINSGIDLGTDLMSEVAYTVYLFILAAI